MKLFFTCIIFLFFAGCADLPEPHQGVAPVNDVLAILGTDFTTGMLSVMDFVSETPYRDLAPSHADAVVRYLSNTNALFVVNRLGRDNVGRMSKSGNYYYEYEVSGGTGYNLQDIAAFNTNTGLLSSYNTNTLKIINLSNGTFSGQVDIAGFADADGYAEPGNMISRPGYIYVALHLLDRNSTGSIWAPSGQGKLLKIQENTYSVNAFNTPYGNPSGKIRYYVANNSLVFGSPGIFGSSFQTDGGCVEFDLGTETFFTSPITEAQAGYEITDCILISATKGIFMGYDQYLNSVLVSFNPSAHTIIGIMAFHAKSSGGYFSDIAVHGSKIYLADRNLTKPGIRIFSALDFEELTVNPVYTGLPPFSLDIIP